MYSNCITVLIIKCLEKHGTVGSYGNVIIIISYLDVIPQANF